MTLNKPNFLPDNISGRDLFDYANAAYQARQQGERYTPPSLANIVMVPSVREARQRKVYQWMGPFAEFTRTGFRPALGHLEPRGVMEPDGRVLTQDTQAIKVNGLWLVGYGSWNGFASATLIGVGRSTKQTVSEVVAHLNPVSMQ